MFGETSSFCLIRVTEFERLLDYCSAMGPLPERPGLEMLRLGKTSLLAARINWLLSFERSGDIARASPILRVRYCCLVVLVACCWAC